MQVVVNPDCSVTISWAANAAAEAVTGYRLFVGTSPERFEVFDGLEVRTLTEFRSAPNALGTTLFITVSAVNAAGEGPRAPTVSVRIQDCGRPELTKPTLLTPPSGASFFLLAAPRIRFAWTPVPGAAAYILEYTGPNRVFTNPNADAPDPVNGFGGVGGALGPVAGTSLEITLNPFAPPGTHQVRVIGFDGLRLVGQSSDAVSFTLVPALPAFVRPIDPSQVEPRLRLTNVLPFALDSRNPATQQTIEQDLTPALVGLTQGAVTRVEQDPRSALVRARGAPGVEFSLLPIGIVAAGGLARQQAAPGLLLDQESGTATVVTPAGQRVVLMAAPPEFRAFLTAVEGTAAEVRPGQFLVTLSRPGVSLSLRLDPALGGSPGGAGIRPNPDGTATVTYGTAQGQVAFPLFADVPGFVAAVRDVLGAPDARATVDGLVAATLDGQRRRLRPSFEVTPGAGAKRFVTELDGGRAFDFGDGRRQRFTIVP